MTTRGSLTSAHAGEAPPPDSSVGSVVAVLLVWSLGGAAVLILYLGSKLTFFLDDWEFLLYRPGFSADVVFNPHGEHIVVVPVLIYKALLATFGMTSALPFRVVSTAFFLLSAGLLFVYLNRRVGQWAALAGATVLLFLGPAWEDLLWPFQVGYFSGMACGLGALLALERGDRRGDRVACGLLVFSILCSSLGLSFAFGAAVEVLTRRDRWRRAYVFVAPLAVYALWWLGWGHTAESSVTFGHVLSTPAYVFNSIAAGMASLSGLANPEVLGPSAGKPLAVIAILAAAWRLHSMGGIPKRLWIVLTVAGSFWILAGFNEIPGREPESSRYQYLDVVFIMMIAAELLRGVRIAPRARRAVGVVGLVLTLAILASNLNVLERSYKDVYHPISQLEKASLGATEVARGTVDPSFVLTEELTGTGLVHVETGPYLTAVDEFGSPAYDPTEIGEAIPGARTAADKVLFAALGIRLSPPTQATPRAPRPRPAVAAGTIAIPAGGCVLVPSDGSASRLLRLPRGGVVISAGAAPITTLRLARFATEAFSVEMQEDIPAGDTSTLRIPPDRADVPWQAQLETSGTSTVCAIRPGG